MSRFTKLNGGMAGYGYIPPGGRKGQVLKKSSGDDCLAEWRGETSSYDDYGLAGDGVTNDTTAMQDLLRSGDTVDFGSDKTFLIDPITLSGDLIPPAIYGRNVTFKAASEGDDLIVLENPHATFERFRWDGSFIFDANDKCGSAFKLHGGQRCYYGSMQFINAIEANCRVHAESGYGVYYNVYNDWIAGGQNGLGSADIGFEITATDSTNRIAANTWISPKSIWNTGDGYYLDHCTDTFLGWEAERNGMGMNVNFSSSLNLFGGYSENNGDTDTSVTLTENCNRVMLIGGRHTGEFVGFDLGVGNILLPGDSGGVALSKTGMGFGGNRANDNSLNFDNDSDFYLYATNSKKLGWIQSTDNLRSYVKHLMSGELEIDGDLNHDGSNVGFYGTAPIAKPTGVAVTAAGIHAALVSLGLIAA